MYSSEDLERFYFQYKTEALPQGISIESFCLKNKVPYNIFSKWYRDTRKGIVEVHVDGHQDTSSPQVPEAASSEEAKPRQEKARIMVESEIRPYTLRTKEDEARYSFRICPTEEEQALQGFFLGGFWQWHRQCFASLGRYCHCEAVG